MRFRSLAPAMIAATALTLCGLPQALSQDIWSPSLTLQGSGGPAQAGIGLFVPLVQSEDLLVFGDLQIDVRESGSFSGAIGAGVRSMQGGGWNLGLFGYLESAETLRGNRFTRLTLGAEALGDDIELRANGYLMLGETVGAAEDLTTLYVDGTSLMIAGGIERALNGFDAEVGWRLPVFELSSDSQLRLYAGGQYFAGSEVDRWGAHLRLDLSVADISALGPGSKFNVGGELRYDSLGETSGFAGVRLRVPLGGSATSSLLSPQQARMMDATIRQRDVVVTGDRDAPEVATVAGSGQAVTVLSDADFAGIDLQNELVTAGADSFIVLAGDFDTLGTLVLQNGQTLMGAGNVAVETSSGRTMTVGFSGASISTAAGGSVPVVEMASNSTLTGMVINHLDPAGPGFNPIGVRAMGVTNAVVQHNVINVTSSGGSAFGIRVAESSTNVQLLNNTLDIEHLNGGYAVGIQIVESSALIAGNSITTESSDPFRMAAFSFVNDNILEPPSTVLPGSTGNVVISGGCIAEVNDVPRVGEVWANGINFCPL